MTGGVLWANLTLLFFLSLFPFTTQWTDVTDFARTPVVVYGVNLLAAAVAYYILQTVIIAAQGRDSTLRKAIGIDLKGKISPVAYIVGVLAALLVGGGPGPPVPASGSRSPATSGSPHVGHPRPPDRDGHHHPPRPPAPSAVPRAAIEITARSARSVSTRSGRPLPCQSCRHNVTDR